MIEQDTVRLLRECDSGAKMGIDAFSDVLARTKSNGLRTLLSQAKKEHEDLSQNVRRELARFKDQGKQPSAAASAMSWIKTHAELTLNDSDETIADLMTDGCGMGVKSLSKYLNQYKAADESSKELAKALISMEDRLVKDLRAYL